MIHLLFAVDRIVLEFTPVSLIVARRMRKDDVFLGVRAAHRPGDDVLERSESRVVA
jgi:hypothetical protein